MSGEIYDATRAVLRAHLTEVSQTKHTYTHDEMSSNWLALAHMLHLCGIQTGKDRHRHGCKCNFPTTVDQKKQNKTKNKKQRTKNKQTKICGSGLIKYCQGHLRSQEDRSDPLRLRPGDEPPKQGKNQEETRGGAGYSSKRQRQRRRRVDGTNDCRLWYTGWKLLAI